MSTIESSITTPSVDASFAASAPVDGDEAAWSAFGHVVGEHLAPSVAEADRTGEISTEAFQLLRHVGVTRALVPVDHGGAGASHAAMGAFLRALGRHDPPTALTLSMHSHVVAAQVWRHKHGMEAAGFFEKVVGGALAVSTGASDWVGSSGTARPVDGGFVVSARKTPASGCEVGDVLATSIRWDDAPDGATVIHCSIPCGDGVHVESTWDTLGMRATGSHTVVIDEVFVPDAAVALIRPADVWHPIWNAVAGAAMPLIMSTYVGIADAAVDAALAHAAGREDPHVVQLVGEMVTAHTTCADAVDAMFAEAADLTFDNDDDLSARTFARKTVASESAIDTVRLAIETTGGYGFTRYSELERLYRDVHGCLFHPLPRAKQTRFSGRTALGLSPVG